MLNRRLRSAPLLIIIALVAGAFRSVSAQTTYPPTLTPDQKVKITFYSYNLASAGIGAEGTKQLIAEFMQANPNITVEGVPVEVTALMTRTQADVAAGNPPDITQQGFGALDYIRTNLPVTAIEEIVPPDELKQYLVGFSPNGYKLGQLEGKTYGIAYTFSTPVLFYNADIFKAAGLDPAKPPKTWEEAKAYGKQIVEKTGNAGVFIAGFGPTQGDWMFQGMVRSNGGRVLSEDRKTLTFAQPEALGVVSMWQDLVRSGVTPQVNSNEGLAAFSAGKVGMMLQTSAVQNSLIAASTGKWDLRAAAMPAFGERPTVPSNSGSALYIMSNTPEKKRAAWEFIKFVTSERGYTIITSKIGYLPLRPAIADDPKYLKDFVDQHPLVRPNLEQLSRLEGTVPFPGQNYSQIVNIMMKAVEEVVFGPGDVKEVMTRAQEQATGLMPQ